jgi:hypothetical protein
MILGTPGLAVGPAEVEADDLSTGGSVSIPGVAPGGHPGGGSERSQRQAGPAEPQSVHRPQAAQTKRVLTTVVLLASSACIFATGASCPQTARRLLQLE